MIGSFFPALREPWTVSLAMPGKKKKKKKKKKTRPFLNYYTPYWTTNPLQVWQKKIKIKKKNIRVGGILNDLLRKFLQFSGYMYNQKV